MCTTPLLVEQQQPQKNVQWNKVKELKNNGEDFEYYLTCADVDYH